MIKWYLYKSENIMPKRKTNEEFIQECKNKFGDLFNYKKVNYKNSNTKVTIICPIHGEVDVIPNLFLGRSKYGCPKCGKSHENDKTRYSTESFIEQAKKIHGDKYNYSKVNYGNSHSEKVCIICKKHGEFWQTPKNHLKGHGCPICAGRKNNKKSFIEKSIEKHGSKYGYDKVIYKDLIKKIIIACPEHGDVLISPSSHLKGTGCPKCGKILRSFETRKNTEFFIKKAKKVHGDKYDYSKAEYTVGRNNICIICPEHGEFWQKASAHLNGHGCPKCKTSNLEKEVLKTLNELNINYLYNKHLDWTEKLRLDFYLPELKIAIECQGKQHFEPVDFAGHGEEHAKVEFEKILDRDRRKRELCEKNNVKLIYLTKNDNIKELIKREI